MKRYWLNCHLLLSIVLMFFVFQSSLLNAQSLSNYGFSTNTSTFTALTSPTVPTLTGSIDDGAYNNLPIGFDFWYMGQRYTTVSAGTNGFLTLGVNVSSTGNYGTANNLSTGVQRPVLAPLWDDVALYAAGRLSYKTTGTVGSRIFVIQYLNVRWNYNASNSNATISFQVQIEESTNRITYHYRSESGSVNSASASIGMNSTNTGANNFISIGGTTASPTSSLTVETSITAKPTTNRRFIFTPSSPNAPGNLTFTEIDTNKVTLNWLDNSTDEIGFAIYYSTNGSDYTYLESTAPNVSTYTATGLPKGQNYYWRVYSIREILSAPLQGEQGTRGNIPTDNSAAFPFSGNALDASGNGFNGTVQNGAVLVEDRFGIANSAYSFNGTNQYISTAKVIPSPGPNTFSYSLWIKTTTTSGGKIFGYAGSSTGQSSSYDRHLYMTNSGQLAFGVYSNGVAETITSAGSFNDGNWHNVICVLGPNGQKLYVDGVLQGVKSAITTAEGVAGYWRIGFDNLNGWSDMPSSFYFQGVIDDISVYNRELNSSEIISFPYVPTDSYAYWKNITLNTSSIVSGTLTNFPYLINLTDPDLILNSASCDVSTEGINVGKVLSPTGADISFALLTGERLNYEIIKYNSTTGELWAWVKLPSVSSTSNLNIKMLFGNPNPTPNISSETWTDYRAVFHFDDNTYSGTTVDATALSLVGTNTSMNSSNLVAGKILNAYSFNGSNQKIAVQANAATNVTSNFTLSAWINSTTPSIDQKIISNQNSSIQGYKMGLFGSKPENQNDGNPNRDGSGSTSGTSLVVAANTWYHVLGVYQGTTLRMYVNGVLRQTRTGVSSASAGMNLNFGVGEGGNQYYFNGIIDEPRVASVARTAEWALSEYRNQNNPTILGVLPSILSIGSLQADPVLASAYPGLYFNFTGAINNNFNGAGNYSSNATNLNSLPINTALISVIIPAAKTPAMSSNINLNSIALRSGATLSLNGFNLNIACNVYNSGVIDGSGGKLIFNGSLANQEYFGSSSIVASSVGDLEISNSGGGTITINSGVLDVYTGVNISNASKLNVLNPATLTLKSNATTFANVSPLVSPSTITGNIVVENYFTGGVGKRGTRMVSSAINESTMRAAGRSIYQQVKEHMVVTGPQDGGFDPGNNARPYAITLTKYNEPALFSQTSLQFIPISNIITGTVPNELPGSAFFLFYRGNRDNYTVENAETSTKLYDNYVPESFSPSFIGPLNQGEISIAITHTDNAGDVNNGFNVVGNPYAATIDWDLVYATNSSIIENQIRIIQPGGAVMTRTKSGSNPAVVVNAVGNAANAQYIQPGQGFYIKKLAAGTSNLVFRESHKAVSATPNRLLSAPKQTLFSNLQMSSTASASEKQAVILYFNLKDSNNNTDETALIFKDEFSNNLDNNDALYINNNSIILGSQSYDGANLAVNYLSELSNQSKVKLLINAAVGGDFTLNFTNLLALGRYKAILKDKYLDTEIDLSTNPNYSFTMNKSIASSFGVNRFELSFVEGPPLTFNLSSFNAEQVNSDIQLNFTTSSEITTETTEIETSINGSSYTKIGVVKAAGISTSPSSYSFMHQEPAQGENYYRLKQIYSDGSYAYSDAINIVFRSLEFENLKVIRQNQSLNISWTSTSEVNTLNYNIERSTDGINFNFIGQLLAKGNSSVPSNYVFQDADPELGNVSYRIRINFSDAIPAYSSVVTYNYRDSYVTDFRVEKSAANVILSWKAGNDSTVDRFSIERSNNGDTFNEIGIVSKTVIDENGNFVFADNAPLNGANFYRIKQILLDTDPLYSSVRNIIFRKLSLDAFNVNQVDSKVSIKWSTNNEINTAGFEVQKSNDGINFTTISSTSAAGTSSTRLNYELFDNTPANGINYYRLKLIYKDADFSLSESKEIFVIGARVVNVLLKKNALGVEVKWEAINEEDPTIFDIERSIDGENFIKIGSVPAVVSNGNNQYVFQDINPEYRMLYYRVREIFPDNSVKSSNVVSINHLLTEVTIKSFDAVNKALGVQLLWTTEREDATDKITIEKSIDGTNFVTLHEMSAAGTSSQNINYQYLDLVQSEGLNYYRLKFAFEDGSYIYSATKSIEFYIYKLVRFNIEKISGKAKLFWSGLKEQSAKSYSIERSVNGQAFTKVGSVNVKGGLSENDYEFVDETALKGINYYKLVLNFDDGVKLEQPIKAFNYLKFEGYLSEFNLVKQGFKTLLNWKTSNDTYIRRFEVESSLDGKIFNNIASIEVKNHSVNGNSYDFEYPVNTPLNATVYYRIKLVSIEDEVDYSAIKSTFNVKTEEVVDGSMLIYPNPATEYIEIATQDVNVVVNLFNLSGRQVKTTTFLKNESIKIPVSELMEGLYYMELRLNDGTKKLLGKGKFIKQ